MKTGYFKRGIRSVAIGYLYLIGVFLCISCVDYIDFDIKSKEITDNTSMEIKVLEEINEYRKELGLEVLINSEQLTTTAREISMDMAENNRKCSEEECNDRYISIYREFENIKDIGENLIFDTPISKSEISYTEGDKEYMNNIKGNYTHAGIGICKNAKGNICCTQIFILTSD